jgi:hypothetical protein
MISAIGGPIRRPWEHLTARQADRPIAEQRYPFRQ